MEEFKLINEKLNHGVWVDEADILNLIKICDRRNHFYYNKLIEWYEHLTNKKFDEKYLKRK